MTDSKQNQSGPKYYRHEDTEEIGSGSAPDQPGPPPAHPGDLTPGCAEEALEDVKHTLELLKLAHISRTPGWGNRGR
jgi:hypothetical protein